MSKWKSFIDVSSCSIEQLVKTAYDLSVPVGMGLYHFSPDPMSDDLFHETMEQCTHRNRISLDYVKGRQVKFTIWMDPDAQKHYIRPQWYDHTTENLVVLLTRCGIPDAELVITQAHEHEEDEQMAAKEAL